jgi:hypothetical protein
LTMLQQCTCMPSFFFHLSFTFAVQPSLGHIPADSVDPPAILNVSATLKNKPFLNYSARNSLYPPYLKAETQIEPIVLCQEILTKPWSRNLDKNAFTADTPCVK